MAEGTQSKRSQLIELVDHLREQYPSESFERNWQIYKDNMEVQDVREFLVKTIPSMKYINVAIIGEGLVVDVDGCEDGSRAGTGFHSLRAIRSIHLHSEALESLSLTEGATLVVTTRFTGGLANVLYWVATGEEEEKNLLRFASALSKLLGST